MRAIITVLDNITQTSMPFNEFVLYRSAHYPNEKHIVIVLGNPQDLTDYCVPDSIEIRFVGRNIIRVRKALVSVISSLKEKGIPYVVHIHQIQSGFLAHMAMIGTHFAGRTLFTVHSTYTGYKLHNKILSVINAVFANRITCVSETSYNNYPSFIKRLKMNRISVIKNGVDTERIDKSDCVRSPHEGIVFAYVARLIPIKNHTFLLDVLKNCDDKVRFMFIGAEDEHRNVRAKFIEAGVAERVQFTGLLNREDVFCRLKDADYYLSSSTLEGLPVSVMEAMYSGLPCILSDIPQHRELECSGVTILPLDIEAWVKEINRLSLMPSDERRIVGDELRRYVYETFSLSEMHIKYDQIYNSI